MIKSFGRAMIAVTLVAMASPPVLLGQTAALKAKVSAELPHYAPKVALDAGLEIPGTDALSDLGEVWSRGFARFQPKAKVVYFSKLTKDAVKDLTDGTRPMIITARDLTQEETAAFQTKYGYMPMRIPVCLDAIIVFVHKSNPISFITMEQLDAIYSKDRLGGAKAPANLWGDLWDSGDLQKRSIHAYARAEGAATREAFRTTVLLKGSYRPGIIDQEDSAALSEAVMTDETGIAFSTLASWYPGLKVLAVVPYHAEDSRFPTQETITSSKYPLPRLYYAYVNRAPGQPLNPAVNEFLHFIMSQEGQGASVETGILPAPMEFLTIALKRLDR